MNSNQQSQFLQAMGTLQHNAERDRKIAYWQDYANKTRATVVIDANGNAMKIDSSPVEQLQTDCQRDYDRERKEGWSAP
jgi:hypothetical protein